MVGKTKGKNKQLFLSLIIGLLIFIWLVSHIWIVSHWSEGIPLVFTVTFFMAINWMIAFFIPILKEEPSLILSTILILITFLVLFGYTGWLEIKIRTLGWFFFWSSCLLFIYVYISPPFKTTELFDLKRLIWFLFYAVSQLILTYCFLQYLKNYFLQFA